MNTSPTSSAASPSTSYILCLTGLRGINKRMALYVEGLLEMSFQVRIGSLPRGVWRIDRSEQPLLVTRRGVLTLDLGEVSRARLHAVMCFHWIMLPIAVLIARIRRVPLLYDEHDHYELNTQEAGGSSLRRRMNRFLVRCFHRFCLPFVTVVTCIHMDRQVLKRHLERWQHAVVEIHNYPAVEWRKCRRTNTGDGSMCFVYIGGVFEEKGPGVAARALQMLPPNLREKASLHVFGDGDYELLDRLRQTDGVVVHNSVTPDEFRTFAATHRCVGLSLLADTPRYRLVGTNCTKLYEYLALGMPVIATRVGEFESFIRDQNIGLLVDSVMSEKQLAAVMAQILEDGELFRRMSAHAVNLMQREDMTWEHEWEKIASCEVFQPAHRAA